MMATPTAFNLNMHLFVGVHLTISLDGMGYYALVTLKNDSIRQQQSATAVHNSAMCTMQLINLI